MIFGRGVYLAQPSIMTGLDRDYAANEICLSSLFKAKDPSEPLVVSFAYNPTHNEAGFHCLSYTWGLMSVRAKLKVEIHPNRRGATSQNVVLHIVGRSV